MDAETIAKGLSEAQKNAIIRIGEDGEKGAWTGSAGINWISVALMMRKYAALCSKRTKPITASGGADIDAER